MIKGKSSGYRILNAALLVGSALAFISSAQFAALRLAFQYWDPLAITDYRLNRLSTADLVAEIEASLNEGDLAEAKNLVSLTQERGHQVPEELIGKTNESPFDFGLRNLKDFIHGATTGEVTSATSISGALAADYVGVGDVRDIVVQGNHLVRGEDYDKLTLGLSLIGLATVVPGSGAVDVGASVIKTANKAGKLSKPLRNQVGKLATELIDVSALRRGLSETKLPSFRTPAINEVRAAAAGLDWSQVMKGDFSGFRSLISSIMPIDVSSAKLSFKGALKPDVSSELGLLVKEASSLATAGGIETTFRALEHADDAKELSRFSKLTPQFGEQTSSIIKVLGKSAIKLGNLAYWLITIVIAVVGWSIWAIWLAISIVRGSRRLLVGRAGGA